MGFRSSRRKEPRREEKDREAGKGNRKNRKRAVEKIGGGKKARRRPKKRTMAPSPGRLEVENFLIENYESYLLCRAREEGLPAGWESGWVG